MYVSETEGCKPLPQTFKVSWSALKRWKNCSYSQKLHSEGKRAKAKDARVFLKGNLCDVSMRRWLENEDFSVPIEHYLKEVWIDTTGPNAEKPIKWKGPDDQERVVTEAREALTKLEVVLRENVLPYRYEPEYRFTTLIGIPAPNGETVYIELFVAIDVAVMYPDESVGVWDLKLSKDRGYINSSIGQLTLYDLGIRNHLGIKPSRHGFFTPMLTKTPIIELGITDDNRRELISDITNYAHAMWGNEWSLTDDESLCYHCDVKHACPRWVKPSSLKVRTGNRERFGKR